MLEPSESQRPNPSNPLEIESVEIYPISKGFPFRKKFSLLDHQKDLTILGHAVLSLFLISCFAIGDYVVSGSAAQKQKKWLSVPDPRVKVIPSNDNFYYYDPNELIKKLLSNYQAEDKEKIDQQKETLRIYFLNMAARAYVHSDVLSYCYTRTFVTITLITFSALLASLCLFFIARVGWERAHNALINIFLICTGVILLYGGLAVSLNYEKNIKENQRLYTAYANLENETLRFLSTGRARDGQLLKMSDFIIYLDSRLEELSAIALDFNTSEILKYRENIIKTINSNAQMEPDIHK